MMKKLLGIGLLGLIISCTKSPDKVETKELLHLNPTSHAFNLPITELRDTVIKMFGITPQINNLILKTVFMDAIAPKDNHMEIIFSPEISQHAVFGKSYFKNSNTANDVYLTSMGGFWYSPLYFHHNKPFEYTTPFAIQFKKITKDSTLIIIKSVKPEIVNGTTCCGPHGNYSIMQPVKPTTIEEYTLITYIANKLGAKGLKAVEFPR